MDSKRLVKQPSRLFRSPISRGLAQSEKPIDREGGDSGAGCINGFAVCTLGEALGHDMWIDQPFLQQVTDAINGGPRGVKSRFTHPGLSGDGLGTFLGRAKYGVFDGEVVRADQHFAKSAHKTPDGDLAGYAMDLAEDDPTSFGASIAFEPDADAESRFCNANLDANGNFLSPDPANVKNLPHVRLKELRAVDLVDSPAANPNGLFHRGGNPAAEAEQLAEFCLGFSDECPESTLLGVHPERAKSFIEKFLFNHNLTIGVSDMPKGKTVDSTPAEKPEVKPVENVTEASAEVAKVDPDVKAAGGQPGEQPAHVPARDERWEEGQKMAKDFGPAGAAWAFEGKSYAEAAKLYADKAKAEAVALAKENADLKAKLLRGEAEPVTFSAAKTADQKQFADLKQKTGSDGLAKFAASIKLPAAK